MSNFVFSEQQYADMVRTLIKREDLDETDYHFFNICTLDLVYWRFCLHRGKNGNAGEFYKTYRMRE